jgi:hypothetical protein
MGATLETDMTAFTKVFYVFENGVWTFDISNLKK